MKHKVQVVLTQHAIARLEKRIGRPQNFNKWIDYVQTARNKGILLEKADQSTKAWFYTHIGKPSHARTYYFYNDVLFIFNGNREGAKVLITALGMNKEATQNAVEFNPFA